MTDEFNAILFIWTILSDFYLGQILSAVRLDICPPPPKFVKSQQTSTLVKRLWWQKKCLNKQLFLASAERPL